MKRRRKGLGMYCITSTVPCMSIVYIVKDDNGGVRTRKQYGKGCVEALQTI